MARLFYLKQRKNGFFYSQFTDPASGVTLWRSTGRKNRDEAAAVVGRWLIEGIPVSKGKTKKPLKAAADYSSALKFIKGADMDEAQALEIVKALREKGLLNIGVSQASKGKHSFIKFLYEFWDYDKSAYLIDKRAHGKSVTRRACNDAINCIRRNYAPYFQNKLLSDITRSDLKAFGLSFYPRLASKTINNILYTGVTALKWAYLEKIIPENITEKIGGFIGNKKKRDILTDIEVETLKNIKFWENKKAYVGFMLAITSALRSGEVRALKREDIGENILYIRNSYNRVDGLKTPKNGEERTVYLMPDVRALLMELLNEIPELNDAKQFVFYSDIDTDKPCGEIHILRHFKKAIANAGINLEGRKIDFHSCRHYVITKWANGTGDLRQAARVGGHKDIKMTAQYADHINENEVAEMGKTAANILQFKQEVGA